MAEELTPPNPPQNTSELEALKLILQEKEKENADLRKHNDRLLSDYKNGIEKAKSIPSDVDVNALIKFKEETERKELIAKGKYEEAEKKLAQQFREQEEQKNRQIEELTKRKRELEIESPAVSALADVVHDPSYVLQQLTKDQLAKEQDGSVVVVDGYQRTPIKEWAVQKMPAWIQKQPRPQGSGASTVKTSTTEFVSFDEKNPFKKETYNLTEIGRLYNTDRDKYERLRDAAKT